MIKKILMCLLALFACLMLFSCVVFDSGYYPSNGRVYYIDRFYQPIVKHYHYSRPIPQYHKPQGHHAPPTHKPNGHRPPSHGVRR